MPTGVKVATAYVDVVASTEGLEKQIADSLDKVAGNTGKAAGQKIGADISTGVRDSLDKAGGADDVGKEIQQRINKGVDAKKVGTQIGKDISTGVRQGIGGASGSGSIAGGIGKGVEDALIKVDGKKTGTKIGKDVSAGVREGIGGASGSGSVAGGIGKGVEEALGKIDATKAGAKVGKDVSGGMREGLSDLKNFGKAVGGLVLPPLKEAAVEAAKEWGTEFATKVTSGHAKEALGDVANVATSASDRVADAGKAVGVNLDSVRDFGKSAADTINGLGDAAQGIQDKLVGAQTLVTNLAKISTAVKGGDLSGLPELSKALHGILPDNLSNELDSVVGTFTNAHGAIKGTVKDTVDTVNTLRDALGIGGGTALLGGGAAAAELAGPLALGAAGGYALLGPGGISDRLGTAAFNHDLFGSRTFNYQNLDPYFSGNYGPQLPPTPVIPVAGLPEPTPKATPVSGLPSFAPLDMPDVPGQPLNIKPSETAAAAQVRAEAQTTAGHANVEAQEAIVQAAAATISVGSLSLPGLSLPSSPSLPTTTTSSAPRSWWSGAASPSSTSSSTTPTRGAAGIPGVPSITDFNSYDVGSDGPLPNDQLAKVHKGEVILPADQVNAAGGADNIDAALGVLAGGPQQPQGQSGAGQSPPNNKLSQDFARTLGFLPASGNTGGVPGTSSFSHVLNLGNQVVGGLIDTGASAAETAVNAGIAAGTFGASAAAGGAGGAAANFGIQLGATELKRVVSFGFQAASILHDALMEQTHPFGAPRWKGYDYTQFLPTTAISSVATTTAEKAINDAVKQGIGGPQAQDQGPAGISVPSPAGTGAGTSAAQAQSEEPGGPVSPATLPGSAPTGPPTPQPGDTQPGVAPPGPPGGQPQTGPSGGGSAAPFTNPGLTPPGGVAPPPPTVQGPSIGTQSPMAAAPSSPSPLQSLFPPTVFDDGGVWEPGTLGMNSGSRPEVVLSPQQLDSMNKPPTAAKPGDTYYITGLDADDVMKQVDRKQRLAMMQYSGRPGP